MARHKIRTSVGSQIFDVANYTFLALLGIATVGPFLYLVAGSLTDATTYRLSGVSFDPSAWTLDSYRILLGTASRIYQAFGVTIYTTIVGTFLSLLTTAALAYGLAQKQVPGRNLLVFLIFFTILFSGGIVPFYLVVNWGGMIDTLWSLMIPFMISPWFLLIMMKFFESLPKDLEDAGRIDGCSELGIFWRIVLPLSKPVLATIGLFYAVERWNEWFWASIFLTDSTLHPLQLVLRAILSTMLPITDPNAAADLAQQQMTTPPPLEVLRMASIVVAVLPIALVYPFLQRYFVKGVMIGAIKG
jgi:putative aldouronate transport system permease protein